MMNTEIPNEPPTDAVFTQQPASGTTTNNELKATTVDNTALTQWQPTGYRIVIKLPYVGDDKTPLLGVRVTPRIPQECFNPSVKEANQPIYNNDILYPLPAESKAAPTAADSPIEITRVDSPGPLPRLASSFRYWRGSLKYRFRAVTNFLAQGYVICGVVHGTAADMIKNTTATGSTAKTLQRALRRIQRVGEGYGQFMLTNYALTDLSQYRHIEAVVPYQGFTTWYDNEYYDATWGTTGAITDIQTESFLILAARGAITSTGGSSATLAYELEIAAGPDFQLCGPIFCPIRSTFIAPATPFSYPATPPAITAEKKNKGKKNKKSQNTQSDDPLVEDISNIALSPLHPDEKTPAMDK